MSLIYVKNKIEFYQDFPIEGVEYIDLNPIYKDPKARDILVEICIENIKNIEFDYLALIESRGFLIGSIIADKLSKGIILCRSKKDRLPGKIQTVKHKLEYGEDRLEVQADSFNHNSKIILIDDLLATGGTASAAGKLIGEAGGELIGYGFLVELTKLKGRKKLDNKLIIKSVIKY